MSTTLVLSTVNSEPYFDPNAFGMACLLGGLFVLGISADMMLDSATDPWARNIGYLGLFLLLLSILSFLYSFVQCLTASHEPSEYNPLLGSSMGHKGRWASFNSIFKPNIPPPASVV